MATILNELIDELDAKAKRMAQGAGQLGELQLERDILKLGREDITAADKLDTTVFGLKKAEIAASAPKNYQIGI